MEEAAKAYTPERIEDYIARTQKEGILEHGFARLASNIGILVSKGRIPEYKEVFIRLMDLAVAELPTAFQRNQHRGEVGNEFTVKALVCCILACEESGLFSKEKTDYWRKGLMDMKADDIYRCRPELGDPVARNWCVFGSASECARVMAGIGGEMSFAEKYLTDQLRFFDQNGMYRDPGNPMVYDTVTRLQYAFSLWCGYDGASKKEIERLLQSPMVALAKKEERIRNRRRQYMYCLRTLEKRGKELAASGITYEILDKLGKECIEQKEESDES
jgi:hypothetical protein